MYLHVTGRNLIVGQACGVSLLRGSGDMFAQKILKFRLLEMHFPPLWEVKFKVIHDNRYQKKFLLPFTCKNVTLFEHMLSVSCADSVIVIALSSEFSLGGQEFDEVLWPVGENSPNS